jgi:TIR domain/Tetratricopeptide repeat
MAQAADFFVSYTSIDRAWAEWVAWQLEAEGYRVIVQAWDFTAGRDWAHEMQQATVTAERVVAVLSAAYLRSAHGEAEWRVFYAQDPSGKQGLLMPVRVDNVDPPGLLKTRVYVDLVDQHNLGDRQGTLNMHEQAFDGLRRVLGDDHPATLITMDSLALARRFLADLHGARELHEQALAGMRRVLGDDHRYTLISMNNLAVTFRVLGDLHGPRELQEQTLDGLSRVLGNDHSRTLISTANLGVILRYLGDLDGALAHTIPR